MAFDTDAATPVDAGVDLGYRLLVQNVTDFAIFQTDPQGNISSWNPGAERILGFSVEEVIGQPVSILFTDEDRAAGVPQRELSTAARDGRADDKRWHERKDGSRVYVDGVMTCLYDGDRRCHGFGKVMRDITDSVVARDGLIQTNEDLERHVEERTGALARTNAELETQIEERKRAESAQTELFRRLTEAQEEERRRLSRELHDELGQQLAVFHLDLHALRESASGGEDVERLLDHLEQSATQLGRELYRLATELRPTAIDDLGLFAALSTYIEEWSARTSIFVDFHVSEEVRADKTLSSTVETTIYRIVQEALTNVFKHAQAGEVSIVIGRQPDGAGLLVVIEDNGVGMADPASAGESVGADITVAARLGVQGMRERAVLVDGTLEIESTPGEGTSVFLRIPTSRAL